MDILDVVCTCTHTNIDCTHILYTITQPDTRNTSIGNPGEKKEEKKIQKKGKNPRPRQPI